MNQNPSDDASASSRTDSTEQRAGQEVTRPAKAPPATTLKLWFMMFLEFFIWGAWLPLIFGYLPKLGFSAFEQSVILNAFPVSAILAMFFSNQFADRNFAAEKFLSFSHVVGGLAILGCGFVTDFWSFCILMWVHCILYVPTISITNSIAFAAMKDATREFGLVRMGGTIGWIAASWPFLFLLGGKIGEEVTYIVAGIASLVLAGFSLTLPHTPPNKQAGAELAWVKAFRTLAKPAILVLWLVTMVDATVHQWYFNWTGRFLEGIGIPQNWVMPVMSIGQIAEILTMLVLGYALKSLGWKTTLIFGILGHAVRFAVFAFLPYQAPVILVNLLHGVCYAFFFATVYIFVDEFLPKDVRSSTQGIFNLMILGVGPLVANSLGPYLFERFTEDGVTNYRGLFLIPCATALAAAVILAFAFWPPDKQEA